ncbi:PIN domain-containing protein [Methylobacter sp.]|uniref:PIN domain-containing protein n=1 Tax=Methylobacter sp. TaxID=2051955 RepID=UPI00345B26A3
MHGTPYGGYSPTRNKIFPDCDLSFHDGSRRCVTSVNQLTQLIPVQYNANHSLCEHYAAQFTRLKEAGTPIGANDLWIACHALSRNATLVTHNVREFERIEGLRVEDWVI